METKYIKLSEVATHFGVTYATIRNKCLSGEIKHIRMGKSFLIPKEEIERLEQEGKENTKTKEL